MILRRFLSYTVGFEALSPEVERDLKELTALFPTASPEEVPGAFYRVAAQRMGYSVYKDGTLLGEVSREEVFPTIEDNLWDLLVRHSNEVLLHSAVLVKEGEVLLLPGVSGSGKTSLTVSLLKRGFLCYSDELAPITWNLKVKPFPLPLKIKEKVLPHLPSFEPELCLWPFSFQAGGQKVFYALPTLRKPSWEGEKPVRLVVFPFVRWGCSLGWRKITPGAGGMSLLLHTVNQEALGEKGFEVLVRLAQQVPCYQVLGDVVEVTERIEALWEGHKALIAPG